MPRLRQVLFILLFLGVAACANEKSPPLSGVKYNTPTQQQEVVSGASMQQVSYATGTAALYVVRRGEFLRWIADQHNVGWEAMLLANEAFLAAKYKEVCGDLTGRFRNRRQDKGAQKGGLYYCNDRYNRPYGNTLRPGWKLSVPSNTAPQSIEATVEQIKGTKVALVIDDTGSMSDDRQKVGEFYLTALRRYNKSLTGVWLYSDGEVRKYQAGGVKFYADGRVENTFGALQAAAGDKPDAIILITDEEGDDWRWDKVKALPPVYGHCLPEKGVYECKDNLLHLKGLTGGQYIAGIK